MTTKVEFLKDHKSFKAGQKIELDDETARRWSQPGCDIVRILSDRAHVEKVEPAAVEEKKAAAEEKKAAKA